MCCVLLMKVIHNLSNTVIETTKNGFNGTNSPPIPVGQTSCGLFSFVFNDDSEIELKSRWLDSSLMVRTGAKKPRCEFDLR